MKKPFEIYGRGYPICGVIVHDRLYRLGFWMLRRVPWPIKNRLTIQWVARLITWRESRIGLKAVMDRYFAELRRGH